VIFWDDADGGGVKVVGARRVKMDRLASSQGARLNDRFLRLFAATKRGRPIRDFGIATIISRGKKKFAWLSHPMEKKGKWAGLVSGS